MKSEPLLGRRTFLKAGAAVAWAAAAGVLPACAEPKPKLKTGFLGTGYSHFAEKYKLLRDSTDFIAKELDRKGIAVRKIGPYRVRGVELTRFVSQTPSTTWLAIHVMRLAGKTVIFFVGRPST